MNDILEALELNIEQLEGQIKKPEPELEEEVEDELKEEVEEEVEDLTDIADPEPEPEPEPILEEDEEKLSNSAYAKMRKESAAAVAEAKAAQEDMARQLAQMQGMLQGMGVSPEAVEAKRKQDEVEADPEPDKEYEPAAWADWRVRKEVAPLQAEINQLKPMQQYMLENTGNQELKVYEDNFSKTNPDFVEAKKYIADGAYNGLKMMYPQATDMQIKQKIEQGFREVAGGALGRGIDPAQAIMDKALESGYTATPVKATQTKPKANMNAIQNNQRRSKTLAGASGSSKTQSPTPQEVKGMGLREMNNLSSRDWEAAIEAASTQN